MVEYEKYANRGTWTESELNAMLEANQDCFHVQGECFEVIINQRFRISVWGNLMGKSDDVVYSVDFYESDVADSLDMDSQWNWSNCKLSLYFDQRDDALGLVHAVAMDSVHWEY